MKVSIITIGDEILIGQVIDSNSARIGQMIQDLGLRVNFKWTISDERSEILYTLSEAKTKSDIIFITGGLGPTNDDITKSILAEFFQSNLVFSEKNYSHLESLLKPRNIPITESHKSQCFVPEIANLLDNQMGTAMGLHIEQDQRIWFAMPGVPYEMEYIMKHQILPLLQSKGLEKSSYYRTVHIMGQGETQIASVIEPLLQNKSQSIKIAYLPSLGYVRIRLTVDDNITPEIKKEVDQWIELISEKFGTAVYGFDDTSLPKELSKLISDNNIQIGFAESCTGGYLSHLITLIPGASQYFRGSIIAYSYELKTQLCGVLPNTLVEYGAVSEPTVIEMAKGIAKRLDLDLAISISGIAGPDGGTPEKPVGTVWIAVGNETDVKTKKLKLSKDRQRNIETSAYYAMILAWEWLKEHY